jgi:UDP-N-acetylglucosamine:LPS N-acetylglucosamine transferase
MIDPMQMDGVYKRADIVVARAGANTVGEIMAVKRPAVLVPIPWAAYDEQAKNARFAREFGVAVVLDQQSAKSKDLENEIDTISKNYKKIVNYIGGKTPPDKGAEAKVVDVLEKCIQ